MFDGIFLNKSIPSQVFQCPLCFSEHRSIVKEKYPNLENRNITKILGEWWTSLGPDEKNAFNNLAADLKEHHHSKDHHQVGCNARLGHTIVNYQLHIPLQQSRCSLLLLLQSIGFYILNNARWL